MAINFKAKMYFTRAAVINMVDAKTRAALNDIGRSLRKRELTAIKEKPVGDYSKPGNPPHAHMRAKIRAINKLRKKSGRARLSTRRLRGMRWIEYEYSPRTNSVVVGPIGFGSPGTPVPHKLEFGGTVQALKGKRRVPARIDPRPYAEPALQDEMPHMSARFRADVKG